MTNRSAWQRERRDRWARDHDPRRKPPGFGLFWTILLSLLLWGTFLVWWTS